MAVIGVSKPYYAIYSDGDGVPTYSAGALMGKLTEIDIEIESTEDNNLYADNAIAESERLFSSGTLTLTPDDLSQEVSKAILGVKEQALGDISGVTDTDIKELIFDDDQNTPNLGVGFIIKKQVRGTLKWRALVLTKVMFSIPSDSATTQGDTIEWQTPELSATIQRDDSAKHAWKREATFSSEPQAEAYIKSILGIRHEN